MVLGVYFFEVEKVLYFTSREKFHFLWQDLVITFCLLRENWNRGKGNAVPTGTFWVSVRVEREVVSLTASEELQ